MVLARLNHPEEKPFERLARVGLALQCLPPRGDRPEVRHVGILFRSPEGAGGEVTLLHLAWHRDVRAGQPRKAYSWLELPIPKELTPAIVGLCRLLEDRYCVDREYSIPYAPRYAGGRFDPISGRFLPEGGYGLTCATFVMAVLASHGIHLLKTDPWPARVDDLDWHRHILSELRDPQSGATPEDIQAVEDDLGCARFRPQEVAAAGAAETPDALPIGFDEARRIGEILVAALLARATR